MRREGRGGGRARQTHGATANAIVVNRRRYDLRLNGEEKGLSVRLLHRFYPFRFSLCVLHAFFLSLSLHTFWRLIPFAR